MKEIRCKACNRFLGKMAYGDVELKCKCGVVNKVVVKSYTFDLIKPKTLEYD